MELRDVQRHTPAADPRFIDLGGRNRAAPRFQPDAVAADDGRGATWAALLAEQSGCAVYRAELTLQCATDGGRGSVCRRQVIRVL